MLKLRESNLLNEFREKDSSNLQQYQVQLQRDAGKFQPATRAVTKRN